MNASIKLLATMAGALLLTACGQQAAEPENVTANEAADTTNYVAEVLALNEAQRRGVMFRAIRDAGLPCQEVTSAEIEPEMTPTTWRATCENGADHLIAMQASGDATVMSGR
ncbi:hypothetical protein [Sphingomonas sp. AX6]|uniref:hypothetical protein n=1 Tax=Sphingomonas sp. AX6 TaxID=2653171 RepID=UPI0012F1E12E|nr:hypothetical protein [Sphingomonas sp. AX6]VXC59191.1 conserved exported hypothetical protein [Sphingomonas sp. AX6]